MTIQNNFSEKLAWPAELFDSSFERAFKKTELDRLSNTVYPKQADLLKAFELCSFENLKLVILGQDPYHGPGQANGLAFSVSKDTKLPPSLKNIFKELDACGFQKLRESGDLSAWARQGVLLLNTCLSVRHQQAASHASFGWQLWTDKVIEYVSRHKDSLVFVLWGNFAKEKKALIDSQKHLVLESSHPSPLSARHSFFGSKPFVLANQFLKDFDKSDIDW
jgi:uracil-DNA glycosylase